MQHDYPCWLYAPCASWKSAVPDRSLPDSTASTLAFALWELAKSPETQGRVRDEILAARRDVLKSTGTDEIPFSHYEKMPLLIAVTKVYRSFTMNVGDNELTFWYKGNAEDASNCVHGHQAGGQR